MLQMSAWLLPGLVFLLLMWVLPLVPVLRERQLIRDLIAGSAGAVVALLHGGPLEARLAVAAAVVAGPFIVRFNGSRSTRLFERLSTRMSKPRSRVGTALLLVLFGAGMVVALGCVLLGFWFLFVDAPGW